VKNKSKIVIEQYEAWASTYDKDKVEIIRSDTGLELGEFVDDLVVCVFYYSTYRY
jgi:hypothetical protein